MAKHRPTENIVLLDMDGTITPPRESLDRDMILILLDLCYRSDIAIVSGSDIDYIMDQCGEALIIAGFARHVTIMPCNGTKVYRFDGKEYIKEFAASMLEEFGEEFYRKVVRGILKTQAEIIGLYNFPVSGSFISARESTVNWSLIGRNSSPENRKSFSERTDKDSVRKHAIDLFKMLSGLTEEELERIDFVLGGQTSIDIYPKGWDKTYALQHIGEKRAWFIGDKCEPGENDHHIYKELGDKAFATSGPEETGRIIDSIIEALEQEVQA
jgi:phosphomannomutase